MSSMNWSRAERGPGAHARPQSTILIAGVWLAAGVASGAVAMTSSAEAAQTHSSTATQHQVVASGGPILGIREAAALARQDQPALTAFEREAAASEQAAVAARTLPDLELTVGIQNYPVIRGENAWSPVDDDMTMYTIGLMREQVRRSRREAEAARIRAEAVVSRRQGAAREREISRDVMIAWINAVEARAKQKLLEQLIADLGVGRQVAEAGVPTGASTPALALQAQAEVGSAKAMLEEARGQEAESRAEMARWIGVAAQRPLPGVIPNLEPPGGIHPDVFAHPHIAVAAAEQEAALRRIEVARQESGWDISWSVMLGVRPKYGEMLSGQVSIPLRLNRRDRQDRLIAEAQMRADAARLRSEDTRRELSGSYRAALADYRSAQAQLDVLTREAIPSLEASFEATEARYRSGQGTLEMPLLIVRRYLETTIQSVEQQARRARAAAELIYLTQDVAR